MGQKTRTQHAVSLLMWLHSWFFFDPLINWPSCTLSTTLPWIRGVSQHSHTTRLNNVRSASIQCWCLQMRSGCVLTRHARREFTGGVPLSVAIGVSGGWTKSRSCCAVPSRRYILPRLSLHTWKLTGTSAHLIKYIFVVFIVQIFKLCWKNETTNLKNVLIKLNLNIN